MASKDSTLPLDPNVKVPDAVKRAAARAESHYQPPATVPEPSPVIQPVALVGEPAPQPAFQPPQPAPQSAPEPPQPAPQPAPAPTAPPEPPNYEHMYNSMKGRYDAAQRTIGGMQEQMGQLGDELMRTQQLFRGNVNPSSTLPGDIKPAYVTAEDVNNFGEPLIDLTKRAALEAVAPTLTALQDENRRLNQQVNQQRQQNIYEKLDEAMPTWRDVNSNPRWLSWLRLRDFNSAPLRQEQLNRAMQAADAPRVLDFFKRFQDEEVATGQMPAPQPSQPPNSEPRAAAIPLTTLAAPGRPNPASGNSQVPDSKPVYTHQDIRDFYDYVRKGVYVGQEPLKQQIEADIFAAQREGRVR